MARKRTKLYSMVLIVVVFTLVAIFQTGIMQRKPSIGAKEEPWTSYTFGSIDVKDSRCIYELCETQQRLTHMAKENLETVFTRQILYPTARCNQQLGPGFQSTQTGKVLCLAGLYKPHEPCYSFSFGSKGLLEMNRELASSFGCLVLAFDPDLDLDSYSYMEQMRLQLFKQGLSSVKSDADKWPVFDTYSGYLTRFKASNVIVDVFSIDITSRDWPALEMASKDGSMRNVKQLVLRFNPQQADSELLLRVQTLRNLHDLGFRLWNPAKITANKWESVYLSYINVRFLLGNRIARNPPNSQIVLPQKVSAAELPILKGPQHDQLESVRGANLSAMSKADLERLYFSLIQQQHLKCPGGKRIGNADDGGWDVCFTESFNISKSKPCTAFSFGINSVRYYDDILADVYQCRVYIFDPSTNERDHQRRKTSWFYHTGLSSSNTGESSGRKMRTLCTLFDELGYSKGEIDIVKMDIEYWEWEALETALREDCLKRVKQLIFETHTAELFHQPSDYAQYIRILTLVDQIAKILRKV